MQELKPIKEGKVREIYDNGDSLIMVATDRISCFDVILNNEVTKKGTVLTQMSKFWFDLTEDILPNHMLSVDVKDMPEFFQQEKYDGKSMMCKKLEMLPIECIVRGYITGSGWPADGYEAGHGQPSFDKQFARDWLKANPDNDWTLPQEIVDKTIEKYLQAYKMLTGKDLDK